MHTQATALCARNRLSCVTGAIASVLVSTCLLATVLAGFDTLADPTLAVAIDRSPAATQG